MAMNRPLRTIRLHVGAGDAAYPVIVGAGCFAAPRLLPRAYGALGVIVTNSRVGALYARRVVAWLRACGYAPRVIEIRDGEKYKTLATVRAVYDQLLAARADRHTTIFALGGGVVGDLAGFVAATFLRGVPFVQVPTSLLAMVDASIGGKVAVNHPRGKNLIGAFYAPRAVIADLDALATLPDVEWRAGMAEVVKHGIVGDAELFESLEIANCQLSIVNWIGRAIRVKTEIVTRDPFERDERLKLNLGHTFAHAFEKLSRYRWRHGDAVALGLVCAARLGARLGLSDAALAARVENLLCALELPTRIPRAFATSAILDAMQADKKRVGARVRLVLPRALGDVIVTDAVPRAALRATLEELRA